jgi:hypothetical protein
LRAGASIDPELLLRILLIGYLYCIASERREATGSGAVFAMLGAAAKPLNHAWTDMTR